jgi:hypothetical protein
METSAAEVPPDWPHDPIAAGLPAYRSAQVRPPAWLPHPLLLAQVAAKAPLPLAGS